METPSVVIGGTFDTIHKGHEAFLDGAFSVGGTVLIGLTSDEYVRIYKPGVVNNYGTRKHALEDWLSSHGYSDRFTVVPIRDQYGPSVSDPSLTTIVVSTETAPVAVAINRIRQGNGLGALSIIEVPIVFARDNKPISTSRVRTGEIDIQGNLVMPEPMRGELSRPFGDIFTEDRVPDIIGADADGKKIIIAVGDRTAKRCLEQHVVPALSVIDLKVERKPYLAYEDFGFPADITKHVVHSGPGFITQEALETIRQWASQPRPTVVIVNGEEDLLALPVIVHAPEGSVVYYGQPGQGMVRVPVDDPIRKTAGDLLARFTNS